MALTEKIGGIIDVDITQQTGIQFDPSIAALANGGFVVSWTDNQTGNVIARLFDSFGFGNGADFRVNADVGTAANPSFGSDVAVLSDGSIEFAWTYQFQANPLDLDVRGRHFNENGTAITGNQSFGTTSALDETAPSITATDDGRYLTVWQKDDGRLSFVQKDNAGNTLSSGVATAGGNGTEAHPSVAALRDGSFALVYEAGGNIFERRMVAGDDGAQVNAVSNVTHILPSVAALENGGYVVAWEEGNAGTKFVGLQRYDQFGGKVGSQFFAVNVAGQLDQTIPTVKGLVGGGFIVAWDDGLAGFRAVAFNDNAQQIGDIIQLTPSGTNGAFGDVDITQKKDGDIVITWSGTDNDGAGIDAQIVRVYNEVIGTNGNDQLATQLEGGVSQLRMGFQANDSIRGLGGSDVLQGHGGVNDILDGGTGSDTATYIDAPSRVDANLSTPAFNLGDALGDTYISIENLEGSFFNDGLTGNSAANRLDGVDGDDELDGRGGNDTLIGNVGVDTLIGGAGGDVLSGGSGSDAASYETATAGVIASLANASINTGDATGDTYNSIERLIGSNFNDALAGANVVNNTLRGGGGNDTLKGYTGNDALEGGFGNDSFVFNTALNATTNVDTILDFSSSAAGNDDRLLIDDAIFTAIAKTGELLSGYFKNITTGMVDANDRILYDQAHGDLFYDSNGSGSGGRTLFAHVTDNTVMTFHDFVVI